MSLKDSMMKAPGKTPIVIDEMLIQKYRVNGYLRHSKILPLLPEKAVLKHKKYKKFSIEDVKYLKVGGETITEFVIKLF